jgi:hypothetical protein
MAMCAAWSAGGRRVPPRCRRTAKKCKREREQKCVGRQGRSASKPQPTQPPQDVARSAHARRRASTHLYAPRQRIPRVSNAQHLPRRGGNRVLRPLRLRPDKVLRRVHCHKQWHMLPQVGAHAGSAATGRAKWLPFGRPVVCPGERRAAHFKPPRNVPGERQPGECCSGMRHLVCKHTRVRRILRL